MDVLPFVWEFPKVSGSSAVFQKALGSLFGRTYHEGCSSYSSILGSAMIGNIHL